MRRRTRAGAVLAMAALAAACGGDGGELRDATRTRQEQQAAQMDSLARDSAAAAQARGGDTVLAVPVFADPPADTARAAAAPVDSTTAPAPAPADTSAGGQAAAPPPAG
ncbi:MAG: hypothetical protein JWM27_314, partial [Gemmatimonadetes bacterium]|nr:hypothetical protein [Gemmatimonadota bacterium]